MYLTTLLITLPLLITPALAAPFCNSREEFYRGTDATSYSIYIPSYGSSQPTCEMTHGATSIAVKTLQIALNHCNGKDLAEDGKYGDKTEAAVKAVQAAYKKTHSGFPVDGIYGPKTRDILSWYGPRFVYGVPKSNGCVKY